MSKKPIITTEAPGAIGPYSQGISGSDIVFVSGQLGLCPKTGELPASIEEQAHASLKNVGKILEAAGLSYDNVVKTTIFLTDLDNFATVNSIYAEYFEAPYPARSCVEISRLPKGGLVEIEAIALK